jgi:integrase
MKKRASGEGSLYFNKSRQLWVAVTPAPRVYRYGKTQAEAKSRRDEVLKLRGRVSKSASKVTVEEWMTAWLGSRDVRPRTAERDAGLVNTHILPHIGKVRLAKLSARDVQSVIDASIQAKHAPATTNEIRSLLSRACKSAVRQRMLAENPVEGTDPRREGKRDVRPLTPDELTAFITKAKGDRDEAMLLLYVLVGGRRGEVLALEWKDVDLSNGQITFRRTLYRHDGKLRVGPAKTDQSIRTVNVGRVILAALKRRKAQQGEDRLSAGAAWPDTDLGLTTAHGTPREPRNIYRKVSALTGKSVHSLRHTAATQLLRRGIPLKAVSALLGHADAAITLRVYSHLVSGQLDEVAETIDAIAEE